MHFLCVFSKFSVISLVIIDHTTDMRTAQMVYRSISNEAPNYLSSLFERLSQNTIRELRNTKTDLKLFLLENPLVRNTSLIEEHDSGTT